MITDDGANTQITLQMADVTKTLLSVKRMTKAGNRVVSILTAATTIYCGLLFLTEDMGYVAKMILFILILISNAVFFIAWI